MDREMAQFDLMTRLAGKWGAQGLIFLKMKAGQI
jgi:hypothetical protein